MTAGGATDEITDVLVVGGGPSGLVLGGELLRRGATVRLIDAAAAPTTQSRAIGVHARTLEILDDLGVAKDLVSRGLPLRGVTMWAAGAPIAGVDFDDLETRFPFILSVSQCETEAVLASLLERRGGELERRKRLRSFSQDEEGVIAVVDTEGGEERIRTRWIVGCDGAHSAVRRGIGASFEGHTYEETFALADVRVDGAPAADRTRVTTYFGEDGAVAFFPMTGDRFRIIVTAWGVPGPDVALEDLRASISARVGSDVRLLDVAWLTSFRIHCRQVERYREGRAFLVGDAAHIHSPVGGQGMNTGMQDAHCSAEGARAKLVAGRSWRWRVPSGRGGPIACAPLS